MSGSPSRDQLLRRIRLLETRVRELESAAEGSARSADDLAGLGQFAGSIVHDLNNLLVAVLGNAGLALMDLSPYSACRPLLQEVEEAAQRAADLASQMLAVAGHVQPPGTAAEEPAIGPEPSADSAAPTEIAEPAEVAPNWRGEGLVLVVDDEQMVRILAKRVLEKFGFQVMSAEDGRQAIEIFRPHAPEFVAVLLDVTMPVLGGAETLHELRRLRPDLRVILSSGYDEHQATARIAHQEVVGFLPKPYLPTDLIAKVREALEA